MGILPLSLMHMFGVVILESVFFLTICMFGSFFQNASTVAPAVSCVKIFAYDPHSSLLTFNI